MIPSNGSTNGILTFLRRGDFVISQLKGVAIVCNNPLLEELLITSIGGGRGPTFIGKGVLLCFGVSSHLGLLLSLTRSERG